MTTPPPRASGKRNMHPSAALALVKYPVFEPNSGSGTHQSLSTRLFPLPRRRRIQEVERTVLGQKVSVQLWDCGGGIQYEALWPIMSKGIEGIIMVYDGKRQDQEKELERVYVKFAQPARLNVTQVGHPFTHVAQP